MDDTPPSQAVSNSMPSCWGRAQRHGGNEVAQLLESGAELVCVDEAGGYARYTSTRGAWKIISPTEDYASDDLAVRLAIEAPTPTEADLAGAKWAGNFEMRSPHVVLESLDGSFTFAHEDEARGRKGLRTPQIGAVHAVMAHWTLKHTVPATVVMPTGTGKTETMLSLFTASRPKLLLVLVPSDALREQLSKKFQTYGVLKEFGVVSSGAMYPAVGKLTHGFKEVQDALDFTDACNIIVTTPNALNHSSPEAKAALLAKCSHLFIDEAHHIAAPTWKQIRNEFASKHVVQFTATPFREDGAELGGKLVYVFPLKAAQEQGYFSRINYSAVIDFDDLDAAIAEKAVELLRADIGTGLNHVLMARVRRIGRAKDLLPIYERLAPDLKPVILHSELKPKRAQKAALAAVKNGESRIIICVDMLGEGFDLPSLKVAAIHDPHKSLGITLQFIGRFARVSGGGIGEASVVVGRTDPNFDENLKKLYAEDADWNLVVNNLSAAAIGEQEELSEFEEGFGSSLPEEVSINNIAPKMSMVAYMTYCADWRTDELEKFFAGRLYTNPIAINEAEHVAWLVTREISSVPWGDTKTIEQVTYDFYAFHWDPETKLLYINSSNNDGVHEELAKAVCGETAARIKGNAVYRTMAKIKRRVPTNVGLLDSRNKKRSFSMVSGSNVTEAFPTAEAQTKTQTNIFAYGFERGLRVSMGISLKGRIWSYQSAPTLKHWVDWCKRVGPRLIDNSINYQEVIDGFIKPIELETRPELVPLALEWPWELFQSLTEDLRVEHQGVAVPLIDVELRVREFTRLGPILFQLTTPTWALDYSLDIRDGKQVFTCEGSDANVVTSRRSISASDFLNAQGLRVFMEQDALIDLDAILIKPNRELPPLDPESLTPIDWSGIDLHKESQGRDRESDSIQFRMITEISAQAQWDVIIDDDGSGEMADIVAARIEGNRLVVLLVHCKYSMEPPGARVDDLYQVCGQAQKSVEWRRKPDLFFRHLIRRERNRRADGYSGIVQGTPEKLYELADKAQFLLPEFHISIVQPGVSKARVSRQQLDLLACTQVYVSEVADSDLAIYTSA